MSLLSKGDGLQTHLFQVFAKNPEIPLFWYYRLSIAPDTPVNNSQNIMQINF